MNAKPTPARATEDRSDRLSLGALMIAMVVTHVWFFTQALSYAG